MNKGLVSRTIVLASYYEFKRHRVIRTVCGFPVLLLYRKLAEHKILPVFVLGTSRVAAEHGKS